MTDPKDGSKLEQIVEHLIGFLETKTELLKLEIKEELITSMAKMLIWLFSLVVLLMFVWFLGMALSNYLNVVLQTNYWGYFIVCGAFLILGLLLIVLRRTSWFQGIIVYFTEKILNRSLTNEAKE